MVEFIGGVIATLAFLVIVSLLIPDEWLEESVDGLCLDELELEEYKQQEDE